MPARVVKVSSPEGIPTEAIEGKPTLVYWDICGLAQPIRLALECAGVEYFDVRIEAGEAGTAGYKQTWFKRKAEVGAAGTRFPNLPYFMDATRKLPQSNAILSYIGRAHGLIGPEPDLVDLVLQQTSDLDDTITGACYRNFAGLATFLDRGLAPALEEWKLLLADKPFTTGPVLTVADLKIYETFRKIKIIEAEHGTQVFARFPELEAFLDRVRAHPNLVAYRASPAHIERPLNNPHAQFR